MTKLWAIPMAILILSLSAKAQGKLTATVTPHSVALTCTTSATPNVAGYNFYRAATAAGPFTNISSIPTPPTTCAYTDNSVVAGATYVYQVTSFCPPLPAGCSTANGGIAGESLPSPQFTATIPNPQPPSAPTGLSGTIAVLHIGSQNKVTAAWSDTPNVSMIYAMFNHTKNYVQENGSPTPTAAGTYSVTYTGAPFDGVFIVCDANNACLILPFIG